MIEFILICLQVKNKFILKHVLHVDGCTAVITIDKNPLNLADLRVVQSLQTHSVQPNIVHIILF